MNCKKLWMLIKMENIYNWQWWAFLLGFVVVYYILSLLDTIDDSLARSMTIGAITVWVARAFECVGSKRRMVVYNMIPATSLEKFVSRVVFHIILPLSVAFAISGMLYDFSHLVNIDIMLPSGKSEAFHSSLFSDVMIVIFLMGLLAYLTVINSKLLIAWLVGFFATLFLMLSAPTFLASHGLDLQQCHFAYNSICAQLGVIGALLFWRGYVRFSRKTIQ